jgi:putative aldouronate transport system permease protein
MMVLQVIWKESGWSTVMFLAALSAIDLNLYEAAVVDGASKWRRMWHITLPGLRTIIALLLILRLGSVLSVGFEQIFLQQQGVSSSVSQVIDTFVYSRGIVNGQWGIATAAGLIKAAVGVVLIYTSNKIAKKLGGEGLF